jgi:hypothetical protein
MEDDIELPAVKRQIATERAPWGWIGNIIQKKTNC